jgi:hypothetical protein
VIRLGIADVKGVRGMKLYPLKKRERIYRQNGKRVEQINLKQQKRCKPYLARKKD